MRAALAAAVAFGVVGVALMLAYDPAFSTERATGAMGDTCRDHQVSPYAASTGSHHQTTVWPSPRIGSIVVIVVAVLGRLAAFDENSPRPHWTPVTAKAGRDIDLAPDCEVTKGCGRPCTHTCRRCSTGANSHCPRGGKIGIEHRRLRLAHSGDTPKSF